MARPSLSVCIFGDLRSTYFDLFRDQFEDTFLTSFEIILGHFSDPFRDHFGALFWPVSGSFWGHFSELFRDHFADTFLVSFGIILRTLF